VSEHDLRETWVSGQPLDPGWVTNAMNAVREEETRDARGRERWIHRIAVLAVLGLCPVLLWCAAFGVAPMVRAGYALMAVGTAMMVFAEWLFSAWSRQGLPGPVDTRSQLQKTAFVLSRQAHLLRTAPLWCAPIFAGTALVVTWVYRERSHPAAYVLWGLVGAAWLLAASSGRSQGAALDTRRNRLLELLNDWG